MNRKKIENNGSEGIRFNVTQKEGSTGVKPNKITLIKKKIQKGSSLIHTISLMVYEKYSGWCSFSNFCYWTYYTS